MMAARVPQPVDAMPSIVERHLNAAVAELLLSEPSVGLVGDHEIARRQVRLVGEPGAPRACPSGVLGLHDLAQRSRSATMLSSAIVPSSSKDPFARIDAEARWPAQHPTSASPRISTNYRDSTPGSSSGCGDTAAHAGWVESADKTCGAHACELPMVGLAPKHEWNSEILPPLVSTAVLPILPTFFEQHVADVGADNLGCEEVLAHADRDNAAAVDGVRRRGGRERGCRRDRHEHSQKSANAHDPITLKVTLAVAPG